MRSSRILARTTIENYRIWAEDHRRNWQPGWRPTPDPTVVSSELFDAVAVCLAFASDLAVMEDLGVRVDDEGFTLIDGRARVIHCATPWRDLDAFEDLLVGRMLG